MNDRNISFRSGGSRKAPPTAALGAFAAALLLIVITRASLKPSGVHAIPTNDERAAAAERSEAARRAERESWSATAWLTGPTPVRRVFIVGCGHSGTSLLLRTVGNLRGVRCQPRETALFIKRAEESDSALAAVLDEWDQEARQGGYVAWVEKTPRHVHHMSRALALDPRGPGSNGTRALFIHRDGRAVVASLAAERGQGIARAAERWVADNAAALPHMAAGVALPVAFEEFTSREGVLRVLRRITAFLELDVPPGELPLALLPGTRPRSYQEYCTPYDSDTEKVSDLGEALVESLAGIAPPRAAAATADDVAGSGMGEAMVAHNELRTQQMAAAWGVPEGSSARTLSPEEEKEFFAVGGVAEMMRQLGYPDRPGAGE